jgi:cell division protein FtsN
VPITPQIVSQVREEKKEYLLGEIRYYTSVNIALVRDRAGTSSLDLETQELGRNTGPQNTRTTQSASGAEPEPFQDSQTITILTFKEGGSSLNQSRISRDDEGQLGSINPKGDIFEINYPERRITLGFVLNREKNWYDLEFAIEETKEGRVPLALTGARPHLLIYYRTVFPESGETRIQLNNEPPAKNSSAVTGWEPDMAQFLPLQTPPPDTVNSVQPTEQLTVSVQPFDNTPVEQKAQSVAIPDEPVWSAPYSAAGDVLALGDASDPGDVTLEPAPERAPPAPSWAPESATPPEFPPIPVILPLDDYEDSRSVEVVLIMGRSVLPDTAPVRTVSVIVPAAKESHVPGNYYTVQVGAFRDQKNASSVYTALEREGFNPLYECYQSLTRVVIPAVDQKDLARTREKIRALGFGEPYVRR